MYTLDDYGSMIADRARMDPYAFALKKLVGPDSVVLDIGTTTGIHALLACKSGARRVYAIEPDAEAALGSARLPHVRGGALATRMALDNTRARIRR